MWVFKGEGWGVTLSFSLNPQGWTRSRHQKGGGACMSTSPFSFFSPTLFINELNLIERMPVEQAQLLVQCWRGIARDERAFSMWSRGRGQRWGVKKKGCVCLCRRWQDLARNEQMESCQKKIPLPLWCGDSYTQRGASRHSLWFLMAAVITTWFAAEPHIKKVWKLKPNQQRFRSF